MLEIWSELLSFVFDLSALWNMFFRSRLFMIYFLSKWRPFKSIYNLGWLFSESCSLIFKFIELLTFFDSVWSPKNFLFGDYLVLGLIGYSIDSILWWAYWILFFILLVLYLEVDMTKSSLVIWLDNLLFSMVIADVLYNIEFLF